MEEEKQYVLVQDNDSHWYVIPEQIEIIYKSLKKELT